MLVNVDSSPEINHKKEWNTSIPQLNNSKDLNFKSKVIFKPEVLAKQKHISSESFKSLAKIDLYENFHSKQKESNILNKSCDQPYNDELAKFEYGWFEQRIKNQEFDRVVSVLDHLGKHWKYHIFRICDNRRTQSAI